MQHNIINCCFPRDHPHGRRRRELELSSKAQQAETKTAVPETETGDIEMRDGWGRGRRQDEEKCGEQAITGTNVT